MGEVSQLILSPFSSQEPVVSWSRGQETRVGYKLSPVALGTRMFCRRLHSRTAHARILTIIFIFVPRASILLVSGEDRSSGNENAPLTKRIEVLGPRMDHLEKVGPTFSSLSSGAVFQVHLNISEKALSSLPGYVFVTNV